MNPIFFLTGSRRVLTDAESGTELLNICLQYGISYCDFVCADNGAIAFSVSVYAAKRLSRLCAARGIQLRILRSGGLPLLLWRYRGRAGLMIGGLLSVALLVLSGRFVWDVRVLGNAEMSEGEVLEELRDCGFGVGSYIPSVQTEQLENRVLIASNRISWIAVRINGTVAEVQVIEHTPAPPEEERGKPANLVAAMDGQIELIELYRGNAIVSIGQAVRRGELLVSGLYESQTVGVRYTRAAGKILARTEREFLVEVPLSYEKKLLGEEKCNRITLNFFNFSLKIFENSGNEGGMCDIINKDREFSLPNGRRLPLSVKVEKRLPYTMVTATRTPEAALSLAYEELDRQMSSLSDNTELLTKRIETTLTETALILRCTVTCIEDIAVQQEFEILP